MSGIFIESRPSVYDPHGRVPVRIPADIIERALDRRHVNGIESLDSRANLIMGMSYLIGEMHAYGLISDDDYRSLADQIYDAAKKNGALRREAKTANVSDS